MSGWNLPPGCSVSDLPGNRPSDARAEAIYDAIYAALENVKLTESQEESVPEALFKN